MNLPRFIDKDVKASDVIDMCSFTKDGKIIEEFTNKAIQIVGTELVTMPTVHTDEGSSTAMLIGPLPFYFCAGPRQFVNVYKSGATIQVKLVSEFAQYAARLVYKVVYLDTCERNPKCIRHNIVCLSKVHTIQAAKAGYNNRLVVHLPFNGLMKDLRVLVSGQVNRIELLLNSHKHMSISAIMASRAFTKVKDCKVLHIPFCHDINSNEPNSHVNFGRADSKMLYLCMENPGTYDVTIVGRQWEI